MTHSQLATRNSQLLSLHPFRARLPNFEGPLEILVELVRRGEINALELALSVVVVSYLENLRANPTHDLEEVGEFVVLVATLLELKSRLLLPDAATQKVETPTAALVSTKQQLVKHASELKRVEVAAAFLAERSRQRRRLLRRLADDLAPNGDGDVESLRDVEIGDLVAAFSRIMSRGVDDETVTPDSTPIGVYQDRIEADVWKFGRLVVAELFVRDSTRIERVGKFVALLELIKAQRLWIEWDAALGELVVMPARPMGTSVERPMQPLPPPLLKATGEIGISSEGDEPNSWPDLPRVPELPTKRNPWEGYKPLRPRGEPPQPFASA